MDLDQLYFHQHLPAMRACAANDPGDQAGYQALADKQGGEIAALQKTLKAPAASIEPVLGCFSAFRLSPLQR